jgi:hypothetical protein
MSELGIAGRLLSSPLDDIVWVGLRDTTYTEVMMTTEPTSMLPSHGHVDCKAEPVASPLIFYPCNSRSVLAVSRELPPQASRQTTVFNLVGRIYGLHLQFHALTMPKCYAGVKGCKDAIPLSGWSADLFGRWYRHSRT